MLLIVGGAVGPGIETEVRLHRVAGQESALIAATALADLTSCDLLIDATANAEVFLRLATATRVASCPMCWGEVFAGGFGGLIARARPNLDPPPTDVRAAILNYFETLPPAPSRQARDYDIAGSEPVIAFDCEVSQIAMALTQLSLDLALKRSPSAFPYSAYLLGLRRGWIFSQPFDTQPIDIVGRPWHSVQNPALREDDRIEALKALLDLCTGGVHANADLSS